MQRKAVVLGILILLMGQNVNAQYLKNVEYTFNVFGLTDGEKVSIAYYLGDKTYIKEELTANDNRVTFKSDSLHVGLYLFIFSEDDNEFFQFIVNEPKFTINTTYENKQSDLVVYGSPENKMFYEYINFIKEKSNEVNQEVLGKPEAEIIKIKKIADEEVKVYQQRVISNSRNSMAAKLINAAIDPLPDEPSKVMTEAERRSFNFYSYRNNFFDNIDLSTGHLTHSPILVNKISTYLDQLTVQQPDSIIAAVDHLLKLSSQNEEVFKYATIQIFNKYAVSKVVCFDAIYVYIANKYYLSGRVNWVDEETLKRISTNVDALKNNICGVKSTNIEALDSKGEVKSLNDITANFTILVFLQKGCSECEATLKDLVEFDDNSEADYQIMTIYNEPDEDDFLGAIKSYESRNWINVNDETGNSKLNVNFNIKTYPLIYVLDKDKIIVSKKISAEQLIKVVK